MSAGCKADLEGALGRCHVAALAPPETAAATRLEEATIIDDDIPTRRRPAARSLTTTNLYTMALRQAVSRPLGQAVRSASCVRPAVRTFAATALRAKEVAGDSSETPNLRVCSGRYISCTIKADSGSSTLLARPLPSSKLP